VIIDWTVALFFKNDVVQLDLTRGNRPAASTRPSEAACDKAPPVEQDSADRVASSAN
jgi:hypothetical protein